LKQVLSDLVKALYVAKDFRRQESFQSESAALEGKELGRVVRDVYQLTL